MFRIGSVALTFSPRAGAVMLTGADGQFAFDGPFAVVPRMQASKPGYKPSLTNVFLLTGTTVIRGLFQMASLNPPADLGGAYQLTFNAAPSCSDLPGAAPGVHLVAPLPNGEWRMPAGDYANTRFSPLDQIRPNNVGNLRVITTVSTGVAHGHAPAGRARGVDHITRQPVLRAQRGEPALGTVVRSGTCCGRGHDVRQTPD